MLSPNHGSIQDYSLISVIGKGAYAKVLLVRNKHDSQLYAIKVLKKKHIVETNQTEHIMTEKKILANIQNPFLINLKASFQDQKKLYFVLQYCPGGQLFGLLSFKATLSEEQAKFFSAQILLALESLHQNGVIYRDLKPQNVLLDRLGYIKLTDFGLSKLIRCEDQLSMSVCGTPEYFAPEIIRNKGHGLTVDWWCLGCVMYQMVTGYPPFKQNNRMELFQAIRYKSPKMPNVSLKMQNLLGRLLEKDPNQRLGAKGSQELKSHPFFEKVNWKALCNKSIKAPFVPILSSESDISNFDSEFTNCNVQSYTEYGSAPEMDVEINQDHFSGFQFGEE